MIRGYWTIRDVSEQLGVQEYVIRYAERTGKLRQPKIEEISGYAIYEPEDVEMMKVRFGLTDAKIRQLKALRQRGDVGRRTRRERGRTSPEPAPAQATVTA